MTDKKSTSEIEIFTKTVEKVMRLRQESISGRKRARDRTKEVMRYIEHDPYLPDEKKVAQKNFKPLLRYNIIVSKLQAIIGNEQSQRRATRIIPDYWENEELVKLINDNYEYIREKEDLERKLIRHLTDGILYDVGGSLRVIIDVDDLGYNTYRYQNLPPLSVHYDKEFRQPDLSDCNYVIVDDWLTLSEIRHKLGVSKYSSSEKEIDWWKKVEEGFSLKDREETGDNEHKVGDRYLVCQLEERIEVPVEIVEIHGGIYKLTEEELNDLEGSGITHLSRGTQRRIKYTTVCPFFESVVLQEKLNPFPVDKFSVFYSCSFDWNLRKCDQPSWGYLLLDVQDRINKGKSQEVDYMIQKLGGSWHINKIEKEAIEDLEHGAGKPNAIIRYNSLKNKAIRETGNADGASVQVVQNGIFADIQFMEEVSSITQALQGKGGKSAESGVLYQMKRDQGLVASNPFYDMKNGVSERIARHFLATLPYVYFEDDRLLPLIHNDGLRYEMVNLKLGDEILKDIREVTARAKLDAVENTPNRLEKTFEENMAFAQMLINAGYPPEEIPFMLIIKHSTIRDKQDWIESLQNGVNIMREINANKEANEQTAMMGDLLNRGQSARQ